jgi:hypothetical protein
MGALAMLLSGCESSGGGGGTTPGDEPRIVESFTCREVDSQSRPTGITEIFYQSLDERIYTWVEWENVGGAHTTQAVWYDPGGSRNFDSSQQFNSPTGEQITWFYVDPAGMSVGRWEVELWLDNAFHRSHFFVVEE